MTRFADATRATQYIMLLFKRMTSITGLDHYFFVLFFQEDCQKECVTKRSIVYLSYQDKLDDYVKSINGQLRWSKRKTENGQWRVRLKLTVNENPDWLNRTVERFGKSHTACRSECVKAMVENIYSHNLNNSILSRNVSAKPELKLITDHRTDNLNFTVLNVDERKSV